MYKNLVYRFFLLLIAAGMLAACARQPANIAADPAASQTGAMQVSAPEMDAAETAVSSDKDGNVYVAFVDHHADKSADLLVRKYDAAAKAAGDPVRVNPVAGSVKAWRGDPPVMAVSEDGTLYIAWITKREGGADPKASDMMLSTSKDGGRSFSAPVKVDQRSESQAYGLVNMISDVGGQIAISWLEEPKLKTAAVPNLSALSGSMMMFHHKEEVEPNQDLYFVTSADGGKTFSERTKLATDVCPCCKTSIAASPDSRFYVSWRQVLPGGFRHIAVASSGDKGAHFSDRTVVSDDKWKIDACPVTGAAMNSGANGALSVLWYTAGEAGEPGLYRAESLDGGKTFGPRNLVSAEAVSGTPVLLSDSTCVFAARENSVIVRFANGSYLKIPDASLPAAALSRGWPVVAFVRTEGEKRSVWIKALSADSRLTTAG